MLFLKFASISSNCLHSKWKYFLSFGHLVLCHVLRGSRFKLMKSAILFGTGWKECLNLMEGVEVQDAFWIYWLKCSTASKTSLWIFQTFMFSWSLTISWNILQFVFELCKWHGGRTCFPILSNLSITGEWSDESSKQDLHVAHNVDNPFVMKKSIRSDLHNFFLIEKIVKCQDRLVII